MNFTFSLTPYILDFFHSCLILGNSGFLFNLCTLQWGRSHSIPKVNKAKRATAGHENAFHCATIFMFIMTGSSVCPSPPPQYDYKTWTLWFSQIQNKAFQNSLSSLCLWQMALNCVRNLCSLFNRESQISNEWLLEKRESHSSRDKLTEGLINPNQSSLNI